MKTVIASLVLLMLVGCAKKSGSAGSIAGKWEFLSMTMPGANGAAGQSVEMNDGSGMNFGDNNKFSEMGKGGVVSDSGTYSMMDDSHVITSGKRGAADTVGVTFSGPDTMRVTVPGQNANAVLKRAK
jgi:hypothetical protein